MKRTVTTLILTILTSFAFAITPSNISTLMFNRLYAQAVNCNDFPVMQAIYDATQTEFCGIMNDTYTNTNQRWSSDQLQNLGYYPATEWNTTPYSGEMITHLRAFNNGEHLAFVVLIEIPEVDNTFIILGFEPL
jgi:hypothetical protein